MRSSFGSEEEGWRYPVATRHRPAAHHDSKGPAAHRAPRLGTGGAEQEDAVEGGGGVPASAGRPASEEVRQQVAQGGVPAEDRQQVTRPASAAPGWPAACRYPSTSNQQ